MHARQIAEQIKSMKGLMDEANRTLIAHRFMRLIGDELKAHASFDALKDWQKGGAKIFMRLCELTAERPRVASTIQIDPSKLAAFCNKWNAVEMFRPKDEEEAAWKPITAEMNDLRQSMIRELEELAKEDDDETG